MKANLPKQLKRILVASSLSLAVFLLPLKSEAITVQEVPNPRQVYGGWVTDTAEILTASTEAQLNQMIEELEAKNGTELAIVTVPETFPAASPKEFTTKLFNYWGIGKKEQDNGVLFLISVGDRRVEIETGYGVEGILPDAQVGRMIETKILPRFKQGDFDGGTVAGTKALVVALEGEQSLPMSDNLSLYWILLGGGSILALGVGTAVYRSRRVFLKPAKKFHLSFFCPNCHKRMQQVDGQVVKSFLSKPQKVAQKIGSVYFEGWQCPSCSHQLTKNDLHLVAYSSSSNKFKRCPTCDELTVVTRTKKILKRATCSSSGKRLIIDECHCCNYRQEQKERIPRLPTRSRRNSWGIYSRSGGGGFGGGGSFGSGGSFGGGRSGGGGAGGGW